MQPAERERLANRIDFMNSPRLLSAVFGAIFTIPMLMYLLIAGDAQIIYEEWRFRNTVRSEAKITAYEVTQNQFPIGIDGEFEHRLDYCYSTPKGEVSHSLTIASRVSDSIEIGDQKFAPKTGSSMAVFYQSDSPETHSVFYDPSLEFWTSVKRLGYLSLIFLVGILIAVLVVVFYRPKKTDRYYLPEKVEMPDGL